MHLAERFTLPAGYSARPYVGKADHGDLSRILSAYRESWGDPHQPSAVEFDITYAALTDCHPDNDIYLIDAEGVDGAVAYGRIGVQDLDAGTRDCTCFTPILPDHLDEPLFAAIVIGQQAHLADRAAEAPQARYRAYANHPGPGEPATGESAWLERLGFTATEFAATLRRPHLNDVPDLQLPDGVEVRPVKPEQMREIVEVYHECFRGEWDFAEIDEPVFTQIIDSPHRDETLWQVAWAGDQVVGQVKPFINAEQNATYNRLRGYTEEIGTHHEWRNQGIAGALLARALVAIRERGMTEAVLGVDTNNPGGAFQLYTKLGFELESYEAIYTKVIQP